MEGNGFNLRFVITLSIRCEKVISKLMIGWLYSWQLFCFYIFQRKFIFSVEYVL